MGKRGPKQAGLRYHKGKDSWYFVYDGKEKYFGSDKATAEARWHQFEALRAFDGCCHKRCTSFEHRLPRRMLQPRTCRGGQGRCFDHDGLIPARGSRPDDRSDMPP